MHTCTCDKQEQDIPLHPWCVLMSVALCVDICPIVVWLSYFCVHTQYVWDRHEPGVTLTHCLCSQLCLASI